MYSLDCEKLLDIVKGECINGDLNTAVKRICTDSRNISEGDFFVPIKGSRFDGHDFMESALKNGASGCLTQKHTDPVDNKVIIKVEDTLKALGDIAKSIREKFSIPFVGITGSVGKTSTKEAIAKVLSQKYNILKSKGNFNNEIGLPLTILELEKFHQAGVVEMGARNFGDISYLTAISMPDIAVITNIGVSHIGNFGSRKNILKAKMEIFEGLRQGGLAILNGDDKLLYGLKNFLKYRTVFFGIEQANDYYAYNIRKAGKNGTYFEIMIDGAEYEFHIPVPGIHNVYCALAAIAAGVELNVPVKSIIKGISEYRPGNMRLNIVEAGGFKYINDVYNASPHSMKAALEVLKDIAGNSRTVAILGDMLEMGKWACDSHLLVGKFAVQMDIDYIITVGENGKHIARGAIDEGISEDQVYVFNNNNQVNRFLAGFVKKGDVLLVKGSRGVHMEQIITSLSELSPEE